MRVWLVWVGGEEECDYVWSLHSTATNADIMKRLLEEQGYQDVFIEARRIS